ncbi:hypothetical protein PCE1_004857 [Barthelona sp. PCE]
MASAPTNDFEPTAPVVGGVDVVHVDGEIPVESPIKMVLLFLHSFFGTFIGQWGGPKLFLSDFFMLIAKAACLIFWESKPICFIVVNLSVVHAIRFFFASVRNAYKMDEKVAVARKILIGLEIPFIVYGVLAIICYVNRALDIRPEILYDDVNSLNIYKCIRYSPTNAGWMLLGLVEGMMLISVVGMIAVGLDSDNNGRRF